MKILAVDDDPIILELIRDSLDVVGIPDVDTFDMPLIALETLKRQETVYDAILLDIQMPELDGIGLCAAIRKIEQYRQTPIVMVTAMGETRYVNAAFEAGADDYLNKPFDPFEIGIRLERVVQHAEMRRLVVAREGSKAEASYVDPRAGSVEGTVPYPSLRNYLAQLPRCQAVHSIVAVKVANIDVLASKLNQASFERVLGHVAQALTRQLRDNHHLISYFEHGYFLCVSQCAANVFDGFLRSAVEDTLNRDRIETLKDGALRIEFGAPVFCRKFNQIDVDGAIREAFSGFGLDIDAVMKPHEDREPITACA
jgi:DNA-binding response OmpR family regulator